VSISTQWFHPSSLDAYRTALEQLEILVANGGALESRHLRLTSHTARGTKSLAVDGAACSIELGNIETALEFLEQGRSLLLTQAGRYRTQVDDLERTHPKLSNEFRILSAKMEASSMDAGLGLNTSTVGRVHDAVAT
jgi:hypothetical protein